MHEIRLGEDLWLTGTYLDVLIDSMPDLVWFKDNSGMHVKVNNVFCHTVGKERRDVTGKDHCTIWDVEVDDCEATEAIVRRERRTCQFNELVKSRNGMPFAILVKDGEGVIVDVNLKFEEYSDVRRDDVIGNPYSEWYGHMFQGLSTIHKNDTEEIHLPCSSPDRILEITHEPGPLQDG